MTLRFLSTNPSKIEEVKKILSPNIEIISHKEKIEEIQTEDEKKLVRDKLLKAFNKIGKPVFVEHTGLYINALNGLPAGLTQVFWDKLKADKFCEIVSTFNDKTVVAKTLIGYCDGIDLYFFDGEISGTVPNSPQGDKNFQWDCVFVPDSYKETFAEMGFKKNEISMRAKALLKFKQFLLEKKKWNN